MLGSYALCTTISATGGRVIAMGRRDDSVSTHARFSRIHVQGGLKTTVPRTEVLRDNQSGVCYMLVNAANGVGLTPLLDAEGKPVIDHDSPEV
ncbi:DUF6440 family protein [Brachybacterium paraconglomeratum]|uniref:DUF6440 family protein n=1 Tax=Brachybacterium paraconglomeratum TaxID=173362 RepID=UPI003FD51C66